MEKNILERFGDALKKLMADSPDLQNPYLLEKKIKGMTKGADISRSTLDRIKRAEIAVPLDKIESIARAFNLKAWELVKLTEPEPRQTKGEDWVKPLTKGQKSLKQMVDTLVATIPDDQALALAHMVKASAMKDAPKDDQETKTKRGAREQA